jgi:hypothetical protein
LSHSINQKEHFLVLVLIAKAKAKVMSKKSVQKPTPVLFSILTSPVSFLPIETHMYVTDSPQSSDQGAFLSTLACAGLCLIVLERPQKGVLPSVTRPG